MKDQPILTMKDMAEALGVSVSTISRALKDNPRISPEKREAIQRFAREHHFSPNPLAESLRKSRTEAPKLIGVIIPAFVHYYFASVLTGIEETAWERGYRILVATSNERYDREVEICQSFYENRACGIIISQAKDTKCYDHFTELMNHGIPMVFYDRICTGVDASRVVVDDYMGAFTAVSHLIKTGCRRIAYYSSPMNLEISKNRYNGWHDALVRNGLPAGDDLLFMCDNREQAECITPDVLSREQIPDAFHRLRSDAHDRRAARPGRGRGGCPHPHRTGGGHHSQGQGRATCHSYPSRPERHDTIAGPPLPKDNNNRQQ